MKNKVKIQTLKQYKVIFFDFDGVIKETAAIKISLFQEIFKKYGSPLQKKIRYHQKKFGGVSRFKKIPLYCSWAGLRPSASNVTRFCRLFSKAVVAKVLRARYVKGAEQFLRSNPFSQKFALCTATPHREILIILQKLRLKSCFMKINGSPMTKESAMRRILRNAGVRPHQCVLIGDSLQDLLASRRVGIDFLFRKHRLNSELIRAGKCHFISNFLFR